MKGLERLQRILYKLAEQYAPHLIIEELSRIDPADKTAHLRRTARRLAKHGVLVIIGRVPDAVQHVYKVYVDDWFHLYARIYTTLSEALFPTYKKFEATYADHQMPVVVVIRGDAAAVLSCICGYIAPYVAVRQKSTQIDTEEINALATLILHQLEAGDMPHRQYEALHAEIVNTVVRLLNTTIQHIPTNDLDAEAAAILRRPPTKPLQQSFTARLKSQTAPLSNEPPVSRASQQTNDLKLERIETDGDHIETTPSEAMFTENLTPPPPGPTPPFRRKDTKRLPPLPSLKDFPDSKKKRDDER